MNLWAKHGNKSSSMGKRLAQGWPIQKGQSTLVLVRLSGSILVWRTSWDPEAKEGQKKKIQIGNCHSWVILWVWKWLDQWGKTCSSVLSQAPSILVLVENWGILRINSLSFLVLVLTSQFPTSLCNLHLHTPRQKYNPKVAFIHSSSNAWQFWIVWIQLDYKSLLHLHIWLGNRARKG